eukprot:1145919-Karenia_brevis.AAC.1
MYVGAASEDGNYGPQLWFHRRLKFRLTSWRMVSTRIIFVKGFSNLLGSSVCVISAHAPHELDSEPAKNAFWDDLFKVVSYNFDGSADF